MEDPYAVLGIPRNASKAEIHTAYRNLAKRWHPDRFPDGPERMWAERHMREINEAHASITSEAFGGAPLQDDALRDIERLTEQGQLSAARQALLRIENRTAEWYFRFGMLLCKLGDNEKAQVYLRIAARREPGNDRYAAALKTVEATQRLTFGQRLLRRVRG